MHKAKKYGLTIKLRHAKILICGPSEAGKTSFSRLLRNKKHKDKYKTTPVADAKQLLVSVKVNVTDTSWIDLDSELEIQQLRQRYKHEISKNPNLNYDSSDNPLYEGQSKVQSGINESQASKLSESIFDVNSPSDACLEDTSFLGDTDVLKPPFKSLASSHTTSEGRDLPEVWDVLTLLDTGGQPEFINLLPTINASTAIAFIVFNMSDGCDCLDKAVRAQHSNESYKKHKLNYTNFSLLKCLLSSIEDSALKEDFYPKQVNVLKDQHPKTVVYFVGTHADVLKEQRETVVDTLNERITELVEGIDDKKLVIQSDGCDADKYLHPVDNTVPRDGEKTYSLLFAQRICQESKKLLNQKALFDIPITWFIFELKLRLLYETKRKVCVHLSEVKHIADITITTPEKSPEVWNIKIEEVLKLYHLFGSLLYFSEVDGMKDYVIIYPQWLFCNLNKIIECKFVEGINNVSAINKVKKEGIFTKDLLDKIDLDIHDLGID